jgi:DUF4097 and DUF4098 domain-containing protein YvlB
MEPRTVEVTGTLHLLMRIRSGDIRITQIDSTTATVHVTGERKSDEISIETDPSADGTRLRVVQPRDGGAWGFRGGGIQVDVEVPRGTVAEVVTGSGDLTVEGTLAELEFQSGSGVSRVAAIDGSVRLKSASGDVQVGAIEGDATLTTASGDVQIGSIGGSLHGRSASGDIEIGQVSGDGQVTSASGDIKIGSASADLTLRSVSGDIEVGVPGGLRVWFDLSSTSGDTVSDLEPDENLNDSVSSAFSIRAATVSGDVRIRRASPV